METLECYIHTEPSAKLMLHETLKQHLFSYSTRSLQEKGPDSLDSTKAKGTFLVRPLGHNNHSLYRKREKSVFSMLMLLCIGDKKALQFIAHFLNLETCASKRTKSW